MRCPDFRAAIVKEGRDDEHDDADDDAHDNLVDDVVLNDDVDDVGDDVVDDVDVGDYADVNDDSDVLQATSGFLLRKRGRCPTLWTSVTLSDGNSDSLTTMWKKSCPRVHYYSQSGWRVLRTAFLALANP